jgi:colicin import membrane protein
MAAVLAEQRPRMPRSEQNTPAAFVLALSMHALLVVALWVSVQWRTEPSGAVVVELWGAAPAAAPVEVAPPPPPAPAPRVEPEPERPNADIVLEKKPPPKLEPPPDTRKLEAEKRRAAEEARRIEAEKKQREAEQKKQAEAAARAAELKRDEERREAVRRDEQARMLAQAGSGGSPSGAPGAGGRGDAGYAALLAGIIKPRIIFAVPDGTPASVHADFEVDLLPTGEILAVRLIRPSGLPGYDAAVERAIRRTDPFPRKPDGTVDRTIRLTFRPIEK